MNAKTGAGHTPLYMCAQEGHLEVARVLIKAGSNFDGLSSDQVADFLRKML